MDSDHNLVMVNLKLKLRRVQRTTQRKPRLDVDKLKDPALRRTFQHELRNRFSVLGNHQEQGNEVFIQLMLEAGEVFLGGSVGKGGVDFKGDALKKDERKEVKKKDCSSQVRKTEAAAKRRLLSSQQRSEGNAKRDKIQFIDNLAAEVAASNQDMSILYKITNVLTGGFIFNNTTVNLQADVIASQQKKLER